MGHWTNRSSYICLAVSPTAQHKRYLSSLFYFLFIIFLIYLYATYNLLYLINNLHISSKLFLQEPARQKTNKGQIHHSSMANPNLAGSKTSTSRCSLSGKTALVTAQEALEELAHQHPYKQCRYVTSIISCWQ